MGINLDLISEKQEFWKLSEQAKMALVLVLQKGLLMQMDVSDMIGALEFFQEADGTLSVANPPFVPAPKLELEPDDAPAKP